MTITTTNALITSKVVVTMSSNILIVTSDIVFCSKSVYS